MSLNNQEPGEPTNFAPSPDFKWLCQELFVKIDEIAKRKSTSSIKPLSIQYLDVIQTFITLWRKTVGNDIYPALVLIFPYRDRRIYNIKDITLIKAICSYLKLPKNSFTENKLINWKQKAERNDKLSNFCVSEIKKRKSETVGIDTNQQCKYISINKLNDLLDDLANERNIKGTGYRNLANSPTFKCCLESMSFVELKYFFDILLKNRIIGGQEHKFLNLWHPDAQDYLSVVSDLRIVTKKLWNPDVRLKPNDLAINVGFGFAPQLAKKLGQSYLKLCEKLNHDFFIEEKMDGERIQLHYMNYGKQIKYLSRRGTDYTYLYGENLDSGTISCFLSLDKDVRDCVLDGEMVTFDENRNIMLPFGIVKSSAMNILSKEDISTEDFHPIFMCFDILFLNGKILVDTPLYQRKEYLSKILSPRKAKVEIISSVRCNEETAIKNSLEKAISLGSEGIVLKNVNSKYVVASRNDSWIKVKPEYLEQFGENMDLIIMGRDPGKKDSLLCGLIVYDEDKNGDKHTEMEEITSENEIIEIFPSNHEGENQLGTQEVCKETEDNIRKEIKCVMSFCTIANGISQEEFKEINRKTRGFWHNFNDEPPSSDFLKFANKVPVEWIDPQNSIVLEVKARSIDTAERNIKKYMTKCTLYGGYCRRVRYDKDWTSCYSFSEFLKERDSRVRKTHKYSHTIIKSKKRKLRRADELVYYGGFENDINLNGDSIFQGLYFYVISDFVNLDTNSRISRSHLTKLILKHAGNIIHNLMSKSFTVSNLRIICGRETEECKALIERGYDIISPSWILDSIRNKKLLKLEPDHCFNVSTSLASLAETRVDKFNDSFESMITNKIFENLVKQNSVLDINNDDELTSDMEIAHIPYFLFSNRIIYFPGDNDQTRENIIELVAKVKSYGGKIVDNIDRCNLVVLVHDKDLHSGKTLSDCRSALAKRVERSESIPKIPYIVNPKWILDSIKENSQLPEENYPFL